MGLGRVRQYHDSQGHRLANESPLAIQYMNADTRPSQRLMLTDVPGQSPQHKGPQTLVDTPHQRVAHAESSSALSGSQHQHASIPNSEAGAPTPNPTPQSSDGVENDPWGLEFKIGGPTAPTPFITKQNDMVSAGPGEVIDIEQCFSHCIKDAQAPGCSTWW